MPFVHKGFFIESDISRHAKRRMKARKMVWDEIVQVLNHPDEVTPSIKGRVNYIKTVGA